MYFEKGIIVLKKRIPIFRLRMYKRLEKETKINQ